MIPFTFPSRTDHGTAVCVVYPLTSVSGLTAWIDYTPVKKVSNNSNIGNTYANLGCQKVSELSEITGLQAGKDYINVYYDNSLTKPWSTDAGGYIPVAPDAYGYNMTSSGDYFSTPSATANQITGDITIIVEAALTDWTPSSVEVLLAKDDISTNRSYQFNVQTSGVIRLNYSLNGSSIISVTSSTAPSFTNTKKYHVAVERESATGKVRFYTSNDHITWTQLGTEQTGTSGTLFSGTAPVQFGNLAASSFALAGKIFESEIFSGLAISSPSSAVMKVNFDPFNWTSGSTFTSTQTGEVWTLNGGALIDK